MRQNSRSKRHVAQLFLWPDENGLLIIPTRGDVSPTRPPIKSRFEPSALFSPRSRLLRHVRWGQTSRVLSWLSSSSWRQLSSQIYFCTRDISMRFFTMWLTSQLELAEFEALSLAAVADLARVDLGLELEAVKRYLLRLSGPTGEFCLSGGLVTFR